jgi:hypothetical protein
MLMEKNTYDDPEAQAYHDPPEGHVGPNAGSEVEDMSQTLGSSRQEEGSRRK